MLRQITLVFISVMLFSLVAKGQYTRVLGTISDAQTGDPIPFVNVYLKGTSVGATTGFDGKYTIKTQSKADTLVVSVMGYRTQYFELKVHAYQEINAQLETNDITLEEVIILPSENPAHRILRNVIASKDSNDMDKLNFYAVEIYNKIQIDLNNITDEFKQRRVFKPFEFIFEHVDTSALNGKVYLPVMMSEAVSDFYYQRSPSVQKEVIKASQVSGINNESVSKFLGNMYQQVNVYENFVTVYDKNFASPIADFGKRYYRYYLVDSANMNGHWCYKLMFKPKRKKELTFTGEIWISDTTWAVKEVSMKVVENLNINYVNAFEINQTYEQNERGRWLLSLDKILVDFNVIDNNKTLTGFYAHKTTSYVDYRFDREEVERKLKTNTDVDVMEHAFYRDKQYWDSIRHFELNTEESLVYEMVDTITNLPAFRTYYDIIAMVTTGFLHTDVIDFGPYFTTVSFNAVEGLRLRVGGRTSNIWNERLRLYGHVAYGLMDERFKYGGGFIYLFNRNPRRGVGVEYKFDMEQLGESVNAFRQDNIMASLLRRRPFTKLTMVEQITSYYEHEYVQGISNKITFRRRNIFPLKDQKFSIFEQGQNRIYDNLISSEIELNFRFAYKETYLVDKFNRTNLGTRYPIFNIWLSYGIPDFWESDFEYFKLTTSLTQWFNIRNLGWSRYAIDAGKIFGTLPFALLEIHPGNETYSFDRFAFNKMNYYEFISDAYISLYFSHHFDGFFLNRIPLMRELEWREVVYFRGLVGELSEKNKKYSRFPLNSGWLNEPYYEVGVGVENIFKVLRLDAGWRLSYLDNPDISRFGLMATLYLSF
jgi:hypothetical protein